MEAITTLATLPAILALVNLLKKLGLSGKLALLAAVGLGVGITVANYYLAMYGGYQAAVEGLLLGLGAAGVYDITTTVGQTELYVAMEEDE